MMPFELELALESPRNHCGLGMQHFVNWPRKKGRLEQRRQPLSK